MTLKSLLTEGIEILRRCGIDEADTDARLLLTYCTGADRLRLLAEPGRQVPEVQQNAYRACIRRRSERIPLQYITGEQEFYGLPFLVTPDVLIPRQDTEILVEAVLTEISRCRYDAPESAEDVPPLQSAELSAPGGRRRSADRRRPENRQASRPAMAEGPRVLDLCTGSGCILLAIMGHAHCACGDGTDSSADALSVAADNERRIRACAGKTLPEGDRPPIRWLCGDLFAPVAGCRYDIIVSNPPYIPSREIDGLMPEVSRYEPAAALDGGPDGLDFYRRIVAQVRAYLRPGGRLFFEIGYNQAAAVCTLLKAAGYDRIEIKKDLAGLDRVVRAQLPDGEAKDV